MVHCGALWCSGPRLGHGYGYDCGVMARLRSIGWSVACFGPFC